MTCHHRTTQVDCFANSFSENRSTNTPRRSFWQMPFGISINRQPRSTVRANYLRKLNQNNCASMQDAAAMAMLQMLNIFGRPSSKILFLMVPSALVPVAAADKVAIQATPAEANSPSILFFTGALGLFMVASLFCSMVPHVRGGCSSSSQGCPAPQPAVLADSIVEGVFPSSSLPSMWLFEGCVFDTGSAPSTF